MPWLIPLTEWQAEVAERAIRILTASAPEALVGFSIADRILTAPDDASARRAFVHRGVWKVEADLDVAVEDGEITKQQKATLRKSMISLEDKVEHPEHAKARRV